MLVRTVVNHGMPHFENMGERVPLITSKAERDRGNRDQLSWKHVELMRNMWKGKLVLKGVLNKEIARIARNSGVDGIIFRDGWLTPLKSDSEVILLPKMQGG